MVFSCVWGTLLVIMLFCLGLLFWLGAALGCLVGVWDCLFCCGLVWLLVKGCFSIWLNGCLLIVLGRWFCMYICPF